MIKQVITNYLIEQFLIYLTQEEKSKSTIQSYRRGLQKLMAFTRGKELNRNCMMQYKDMLWLQGYKAKTVNVYLAAANAFLKYMGWDEARVKSCRIQRKAFREEKRDLSRQEYKRLLDTAKLKGRERLYYMMKTMYFTGARVSELQYITVNSLLKGHAEIRCKGKIRIILLPSQLKNELLQYIKSKNITEGAIFRTRNGKPVDRSNLWKEMKKISDYVEEEGQQIKKSKIFPHNLRHLFAQNFYHVGRDLVKLADVLGHSSIETTRIYVQTGYGEYKKLIDAMEMQS